MSLKTREIEIGDRKIILHELSVDDQFHLTELERFSVREYYQRCMSEEDYSFVLSLPVRQFKVIRDAIAELNKDNTLGSNVDFQKQPSQEEK